MKTNELRVGNWVMGYHEPFQWSLEHFDLLKQADLDELIKEPILLTEDILLKCGFKKSLSPENTYELDGMSVTLFAFYDEDENGNLFIAYEEWMLSRLLHTSLFYCKNGHGIGYLHQLQNLYFAITGEELKVEL